MRLKKLVLLLIFSLSFIPLKAQELIKNYSAYFAVPDSGNKNLVILRKFNKAGQVYYLSLNPQNLQTQIIPAGKTIFKTVKWSQMLDYIRDTPYGKAINFIYSAPPLLQDAGIIHGFAKEKGITLTIDLCPSHKPLDRVIFNSLINEFKKAEKPVPVAISITGLFILNHSNDIAWLKSLVNNGEISITWINHTYNHHFNPKAPLLSNFLLEPHTNLYYEIIQTEIAMLQHGLLPSAFFRFPGLISDQKIIDQVISFGLIPIGSDAWLAKGQKASEGSIVLIHGNGNEPIGVNDFIKLLQNKKSLINNKLWMMYDLRETIENDFN